MAETLFSIFHCGKLVFGANRTTRPLKTTHFPSFFSSWNELLRIRNTPNSILFCLGEWRIRIHLCWCYFAFFFHSIKSKHTRVQSHPMNKRFYVHLVQSDGQIMRRCAKKCREHLVSLLYQLHLFANKTVELAFVCLCRQVWLLLSAIAKHWIVFAFNTYEKP